MKKKENLIILVLVAVVLSLAIRSFFLIKPGYNFDINCFISWGEEIKNNGFWSLYGGNYYPELTDYPPLIPLISSWWISLTGNSVLWFKILPTLAELLLVVISAYFVYRSESKYKKILLFAVIFQPALALVTSAWGQTDSILSLLIVLALIFYEKNLYLSSILLFLALLAKPQAIVAILIFFLSLLLTTKRKELFGQVLLWIFISVAIMLIFKNFGGSSPLDPYINSVGRYDKVSLNAFNFWWMIFHEHSWTLSAAGFYNKVGFILFGLFEIPVIFYLLRKRRIGFVELLLLTSYSYLAFFVFPTQIHERYLFPALALLAIPAASNKNIFYIYLILTVTLFYNCFAVLESVYPQFLSISVNLLAGDIPVIISFVNVAATAFFAYRLLYEAIENKR